jgi:hypothetical protein
MNFLSAVVLAAVVICFILALRHVIRNLSTGSCSHCSGGCPAEGNSSGSCPYCASAKLRKDKKVRNA